MKEEEKDLLIPIFLNGIVMCFFIGMNIVMYLETKTNLILTRTSQELYTLILVQMIILILTIIHFFLWLYLVLVLIEYYKYGIVIAPKPMKKYLDNIYKETKK